MLQTLHGKGMEEEWKRNGRGIEEELNMNGRHFR